MQRLAIADWALFCLNLCFNDIFLYLPEVWWLIEGFLSILKLPFVFLLLLESCVCLLS